MTTLLDVAKSGDVPGLIKTVMKGDADVNGQDEQGRTALHYACLKGNRPLLRYLLSREDLDTNIRDRNGKTALQCAPKASLQGLTVQLSQAQERLLRKTKGRGRSSSAQKCEDENQEMIEEEVEESASVSPSTFRKMLVCVILPLLYLFVHNGILFTSAFIFCSVVFYFVAFTYFISEVVVRPPWYHHQPGATHLITRGNPDYWRGWVNDPKTDFGLLYEDVVIDSTDGYKLRGWYVPPPGGTLSSGTCATSEPTSPYANASPPHGRRSMAPPRDLALVLVHGAGRDRRAWERHLPFLHKAGYGCLLFDLREHGLSDGNMRGVTYGMKERYDVISACRFMRTEYGYDRVGVIGTSVGGASVVMAAGIDRSIDLVIAENAMTTSATLCNQQVISFMGGYFSRHGYSNFFFALFRKLCTMWLNLRIGNTPSKHCQALHCIGNISPRPVLLMHGTVDTIVPCKHSQILFDAAREPKQLYLCENAYHCGLFDTSPEEYEETVLGFLDKYSEPVGGSGEKKGSAFEAKEEKEEEKGEASKKAD